ncbi:hypothetical protein [Paenibacillus sinopodophylli]|uniref:hypothetical protein n=1 Tax=Paenibacillus sinopodophylli TaxID=1837342 RepID=UPI00110C9371|nr:hypothetical protein [Paenibacillus sinopodophylli]
MDKLSEVSLENISVHCKPYILNIKAMRDEINSFSYTFKEGHVYGVISQPGNGAWAISYLLAGRVKKYSGIIKINGEIANSKLLGSNSIHIGEGLNPKRWLIVDSKKTIRQQLEEGDSSYSINDLIALLDLAPSRLDRSIKYISNERWNASVAIGLAHSKHVYCFPWFNTDWKSIIHFRLKYCADVLRANNKIMIIPTDSARYIENTVDEIIYL